MNYDASQKIRGKTRGLHGKYEANTRATRQCTETRTRTRTFRCLSDCTRRERMICQQNTHSTKSDGARLENTRARTKNTRGTAARVANTTARDRKTRGIVQIGKHENTTAQTNTRAGRQASGAVAETPMVSRPKCAQGKRRLSPESSKGAISSSARRLIVRVHGLVHRPGRRRPLPRALQQLEARRHLTRRTQSTARRTRQNKKYDRDAAHARAKTRRSQRAAATHITRLTALELPMSTPSRRAA